MKRSERNVAVIQIETFLCHRHALNKKKRYTWKSMRSKPLEKWTRNTTTEVHNVKSVLLDTMKNTTLKRTSKKAGCGGWFKFTQTLFGSFTDRENLVYFAACNQSASGDLIGGSQSPLALGFQKVKPPKRTRAPEERKHGNWNTDPRKM